MSKLCLGLAMVFFVAALSFSGCCCTPMGPGCVDYGCNDCSGCSATTQYIANGPLDALRNARRRMVCGTGCGEAYVGEWISTPPDACDPCCGDQFIGGATKCRPFCWQPGSFFQNIYGKRFCSGDASSTPCPCGTELCSGGCGSVVGGEIMTAPAASAPACGCTAGTCAAGKTRVVANQPAVDNATATTTRKVVAKQTQTRVNNAQQAVR